MATITFTPFNIFKLELAKGTHALDAHDIRMAICDATTVPTAATANPMLTTFTEVGSAGSYVSGGVALTMSLSESGGVVTIDATNSPSWADHASNDTDAAYAIIYNNTDVSKKAIGFASLNGPVDMSAISLTLNPNVSGLITL